MNVEAINSSPLEMRAPEGQSKISDDSSFSFGETIRSAVDSLNSQQKSAEQEIARAVTGESTDLHQTIIALQSADLNFQFGLQVRNKLVGAYEEVMRMQV